METGWMGTLHLLKYALSIVGADMEEGEYCVDGPIATYMGMAGDDAEVVVSAEAVYYKNGITCNMAALMNSTSYGLRNVLVIM